EGKLSLKSAKETQPPSRLLKSTCRLYRSASTDKAWAGLEKACSGVRMEVGFTFRKSLSFLQPVALSSSADSICGKYRFMCLFFSTLNAEGGTQNAEGVMR